MFMGQNAEILNIKADVTYAVISLLSEVNNNYIFILLNVREVL
jgi:hypothetical protein